MHMRVVNNAVTVGEQTYAATTIVDLIEQHANDLGLGEPAAGSTFASVFEHNQEVDGYYLY